jgi:predicted dehydrogenase
MKIKWGVIGAGGIADRRTIPGLLAAENAALESVMEVSAELAERLASKYGVNKYFTSEAELLADPDIDAVYIASPVVFHLDQICAAADAGKHILVEKPVALCAVDAEKAVAYCEQKGVKLAAGFMMRFAAFHQKLKQLLENNAIGDVVSISGQFTCWYPDIEGAWRQYKDQSGGGALMDMGVHLIDLIQYVCGEKIVEVAAMDQTRTFSYNVDDSSAILARLSGGAFCSINSNFNIPDEAAKWRMEFYGTKGRIIADETIGQVEGGRLELLSAGGDKAYDAAQNKQAFEAQSLSVELGNMYTKEIENFGDAILGRAALVSPAADAVYVQKVVEAAYESSLTRAFVSL